MEYTPAKNIDEVITNLYAVIDWAIETKSAYGIFPALYVVVTEKVKEGIARGDVFEDGPRMEQLDVIFANRFLEAFHQNRKGQRPTASWQQAFEACDQFPSHLILQELLVGMNAHINLDLGIAAATTVPGPAIKGLHPDFNSINVILNALVDDIKNDLIDLSPRFGWILRHLVGEDAILEFSIKIARNEAWRFAKKLAKAETSRWKSTIEEKDFETAKLGKFMRSPGFIANLIIWWVKRAEIKDIPRIIKELQANAKAKVKFPSQVDAKYLVVED
jgi:Family of unknown function (DUF5995)